VFIAQGGRFGWSLYAKGGKAKFVYNVLGIKSYAVESTAPIPAGRTQVRLEFAYDGGGNGKGGNVTLYCGGKEAGKGRVDQTQGFVFSADETTDIGYESGTTVSPDYTAHGSRFNGKIHWVQIDLGKDAEDADHYISADERLRVRWRDSSVERSGSRGGWRLPVLSSKPTNDDEIPQALCDRAPDHRGRRVFDAID
jgi:arylsulfatase